MLPFAGISTVLVYVSERSGTSRIPISDWYFTRPFLTATAHTYIKFHNMPEEFPAVEGGGSLILAWQIRNKRVLVVGGGEVSPLHVLY